MKLIRILPALMTLALLTSSCSKSNEPDRPLTLLSPKKATNAPTGSASAQKPGESPGSASPLGQQMFAQKIVEDMSGGTDLRAGRRAADKIHAVSESHNADLDEIK